MWCSLMFQTTLYMFLWPAHALSRTSSAIYTAEILGVLPKNIPVGSSLNLTGPALELAVATANRKYYPHFRILLTYIYSESDQTCADAAGTVTSQLPHHYYNASLNCCHVIIGASCGGLTIAPYFAAGWDVLLFSAGIVPASIFNLDSAPTSVAMVGTYRSLAQAILKLLKTFRWRHLSLLLDTSVVSTDLFRLLSGEILTVGSTTKEFSVAQLSFNGSDRTSISKSLEGAQKRSRVFFILSNTKTAMNLLEVGKNNGMTFDEYVFVVLQPVQHGIYGHVEWFDYPPAEDRKLFHNVIIITTKTSEEQYRPLGQKLAEQSKRLYKVDYENGTSPLDLYNIRETLNSVEIFAAVVNESLGQGSVRSAAVCSGRRLQNAIRNRTFDLTLGPTYVDENGFHSAELRIFTFNDTTQKIQLSASYDSVSRSYVWHNVAALRTSNGKCSELRWPQDIPRCGFSGLEGPCMPVSYTVSIGMPVVTLSTLIAVTIGLAILKRQAKFNRIESEWWIISAEADTLCLETEHPHLTTVACQEASGRPRPRMRSEVGVQGSKRRRLR